MSDIFLPGTTQHTVDVSGPILPHTTVQLCGLLSTHTDQFTLHSSSLAHTKPFSDLRSKAHSESMAKAFAEEGLVDSGLEETVRSLVCSPLRPEGSDGQEESVYRTVRYKEGLYAWSDRVEL